MRGSRALLALLALGLWGCFPGNNHCVDEGAGVTPDAAVGPSVYRPTIQMDLEALGCTGCHQAPMIGLEMVVTPGPTDDAAWTANYEKVVAQVTGYESDPAGSPLLRKAQGLDQHPPTQIDDGVIMRWTEWIELGAPYQAVDLPALQ